MHGATWCNSCKMVQQVQHGATWCNSSNLVQQVQPGATAATWCNSCNMVQQAGGTPDEEAQGVRSEDGPQAQPAVPAVQAGACVRACARACVGA